MVASTFTSPTARKIVELARRHGTTYRPTGTDLWAHHATRLADDEVTLDQIELLLVALERAGHVTGEEAVRLQVDYLRESRHEL